MICDTYNINIKVKDLEVINKTNKQTKEKDYDKCRCK